MKTKLTLSPAARADLRNIWRYTERVWSADQANRYVSDITKYINLLADHPLMGRNIDYLQSGYRKLPARLHVLYYRFTDEGVVIARVLHHRMDHERHLKADDWPPPR